MRSDRRLPRPCALTAGLLAALVWTLHADGAASAGGQGRGSGNVPPGLARGCTVSTTALHFGSYRVFDSQAADSTAAIRIECTAAAPVSVRVELSAGQGSLFDRRMQGPVVPLRYQVFTDQSRQTVFGDGTSGTVAPVVTVRGVLDLVMYGRIPPLQAVTAGAYSDSLTVSIAF